MPARFLGPGYPSSGKHSIPGPYRTPARRAPVAKNGYRPAMTSPLRLLLAGSLIVACSSSGPPSRAPAPAPAPEPGAKPAPASPDRAFEAVAQRFLDDYF